MIKKFILRNYIPLATKGVHYLELQQFEIINIIIGKNGHGKTRILAELNVLPPENKNYEGEGYKYVEKIHNGKVYVLESYAGSKSVHSFKDPDGKELNPNGTQQVQKELVKSVFGITSLTNRMLSGVRPKDRFSVAPDMQRKDFLMELYPNDTRYVLSLHDRLKQALNETVGAIRNQTKRLAEEKQREEMIASKTVEELEADIAELDKRISDSLFIQGTMANAQNVSQELNDKITKLERITTQLISTSFTQCDLTREEIENNLVHISGLIDYHQKDVTKYQTLMGDLSSRIQGMSKESLDPVLVEKQLNDLTQQIDHLTNELEDFCHIVEPHDKLKTLTADDITIVSGIPEFGRLVNAITPIGDESITLGRLNAAITKIEENKGLLNGARQRLSLLEHTISHYEGLTAVDCPDCKNNFKPGFDKIKVNSAKNEIEVLNRNIPVYENIISKGTEFYENHKEWLMAMERLHSFIKHHENGEFFLELVSVYNIGYKDQDTLLNALRSLLRSFKHDTLISGLVEQQNVLKSRLRLIKDNNMDEILKSYEHLDALLSSSSTALGRCKNQFVALNKTLDDYKAYDTLLNHLGILQSEILDLLIEEGRFHLHRQVKDLIAEFSPLKDSYITTLIRKQSFHGVILSIEENLATLKDRQAKLKILTEGLCPKKGLIGKMMLDFIKTICGNVNAVVQDIWSTPLYLLPCVNSKGNLDYKFPVLNGVKESKADDLSECSGGESEILNFALMLVLNKYHRGESSLFLDEVGAMMDEYHRRRFFDYVHRITSTGEVKQVFMVSHYHSEYGMLQNANIIALNMDGLTVPPNVNRNAIIR